MPRTRRWARRIAVCVGRELARSTRWGDIQECTVGNTQKQRLHHPRDTRGPIHHNLAGWTQASPVCLRVLGPASKSAPKQVGANCHLILSGFGSPLPHIPIVTTERMPRTLHPSSCWISLPHAGGAVRVGVETHRGVGFFVGCWLCEEPICAPLNLCPFTTQIDCLFLEAKVSFETV